MSLWKLIRLVRRMYRLLVLLAALSGIGPGALPAMPGVSPPPTAAPSAPVAPAPASPARKVIGSCSTITDGKQWVASCVVNGRQTAVPGTYTSHAAALKAIKGFREANA